MVARGRVEIAEKALHFGSLAQDRHAFWIGIDRPIIDLERAGMRGGVHEKGADGIQCHGILGGMQDRFIGTGQRLAAAPQGEQTLRLLQQALGIAGNGCEALFDQRQSRVLFIREQRCNAAQKPAGRVGGP